MTNRKVSSYLVLHNRELVLRDALGRTKSEVKESFSHQLPDHWHLVGLCLCKNSLIDDGTVETFAAVAGGSGAAAADARQLIEGLVPLHHFEGQRSGHLLGLLEALRADLGDRQRGLLRLSEERVADDALGADRKSERR